MIKESDYTFYTDDDFFDDSDFFTTKQRWTTSSIFLPFHHKQDFTTHAKSARDPGKKLLRASYWFRTFS